MILDIKDWPHFYNWHTWFAWYPVKTNKGWTWLRRVERKYYPFSPAEDRPEYRAPIVQWLNESL